MSDVLYLMSDVRCRNAVVQRVMSRGLFSEFYGSFVLSITKGKEERVDGLT